MFLITASELPTNYFVRKVRVGGGQIIRNFLTFWYVQVQSNKLALRGDCTLEFEVACIDLTPIEEGETRAEIASIGLWTDISVRLLRIPSLEEITREMIGGEIIPRSILIAKFEGVNYLLCSLGDGSLIYYLFTPQGTLVDRRKVKKISLFFYSSICSKPSWLSLCCVCFRAKIYIQNLIFLNQWFWMKSYKY